MKYILTIFCDVCNVRGQGYLVGGNQVTPPNGWGFRNWPSGQQSIVCSSRCAKEVEARLTRESVVVKKIEGQNGSGQNRPVHSIRT